MANRLAMLPSREYVLPGEPLQLRLRSLCLVKTLNTYLFHSLNIFNVYHLKTDPTQCPPGLIYNQCGSACANTCSEVCNKMCVAGCYCPEGLMDIGGGVCRHKQSVCKCPPGEFWLECGSACANECPRDDLMCTMQCVPGCYCPTGLIKHEKYPGGCVDPSIFCEEETQDAVDDAAYDE